MNENDIIINLKVISSIKPNNRLNTSDNYLNIETDTIIPHAIKRWLRKDDRNESINRIEQVINEGLNIQSQVVELNIKNSITGLENFKKTYSKCVTTIARINTIIEKVKNKYNIEDHSESSNED
tara:strand:- start:104 stop:475 length:372 start_codon:yes stop_codon:yes gene_type:complete